MIKPLLPVLIIASVLAPLPPSHGDADLSKVPLQRQAPDKAHLLLRSARSLRCTFDKSTFTVIDSFPRIKPGGPMLDPVVYDAIDRKTGRARNIGYAGAGDIRVMVGEDALSFLEFTPTGNPNLTTVFATLKPGTQTTHPALLAAASGHYAANWGVGSPQAMQAIGSCVVLE